MFESLNRRQALAAGAALISSTAAAHAKQSSLVRSITTERLWRNRDGKSVTWFHPRGCMTPGKDGMSTALITLQTIGGSDFFGPVHWSISEDQGRRWSKPAPIPALGRDLVRGTEGLQAGVCDVVPQYHAATETVLAMGHVVFYSGPKFSRGDQLSRYPVYAVRRRDGTWSERKRLDWGDPRGAFIYTNNCGQRVILPNGDILLSFTFGAKSTHRSVAGVICTYDGESLRIKKVGPALEHPHKRGLLEPSLTQFGDRFFLTIRAEDGRGYMSVSDDGLQWKEKKAWSWDDGQALTMSTTQQHWLTHSDGLFLVYTRKDAINVNVTRWRSPLFMAQVDTEKMHLIRDTERTVLPISGDGVNHPKQVALMGNFHVTNASKEESWVTAGEWMPSQQARGDVLLGRIRWNRPNRLV